MSLFRKRPRHELLSVTPLQLHQPDHVRVLLACSCGTQTDFTFLADDIGEYGRSFTCDGCRTSHWFTADVPRT